MSRFFLLVSFLLLALGSWAFNPPVEVHNGIKLQIVLPQEQFTVSDRPLQFQVVATNQSQTTASIDLSIRLNDDWSLPEPAESQFQLKPNQSRTLPITASPLPKILEALYPIHAVATVTLNDNTTFQLHPIAIFETIVPQKQENAEIQPAKDITLANTPLKLTKNNQRDIQFTHKNSIIKLPGNHNGGHRETGMHFSVGTYQFGADKCDVFAIHPPWLDGTGQVQVSYNLILPEQPHFNFTAATAIRNTIPSENKSDGVQFILNVTHDGKTTTLFDRFSKAQSWQPVSISLADFAGKRIQLSLVTTPGPKNDTNSDLGLWATPTIAPANQQNEIPKIPFQQLADKAFDIARSANATQNQPAFVLKSPLIGQVNAAILPGSSGLLDAAIAFTNQHKSLAFNGFAIQIGNENLSREDAIGPIKVNASPSQATFSQIFALASGPVAVQVTATPINGTLKLQFAIVDPPRSQDGQPRFTSIAIGNASKPIFRVYAGFGNVIENPQNPFELASIGNYLMTRHVGADFKDSLSCVIASDCFPDRLVVNPNNNLFSLETHNDTTFFITAHRDSSFQAAREYANNANFKPTTTVNNILGRQCLDKWGGDYLDDAEEIKLASIYGLKNAVFVKHVWQAWGYDYRLPDIFPPQSGLDNFKTLADTCKQHGIIFAPHDNYTDFYPDATGFSYDHVSFDKYGKPKKAWFNKGRNAQSYSWLPHAFKPWLENNMTLLKNHVQPEGLFIDVLASITPFDYYDRNGNYYPKASTARHWADAFDTARSILGPNTAIMISEGGHDALIGSLDGAQSDHYAVAGWGIQETAQRVPWHDIVSHQKMALFAGGLADRYQRRDSTNSGYASDSYLTNTVIGGRNPMSDGPFTVNAILTYWLLNDVTQFLAFNSFDDLQFVDNSIDRQKAIFANGKATVWANRGKTPWTINPDTTLPQFGFLASTPNAKAAIVQINGKSVAYAMSPNSTYIDTRPTRINPYGLGCSFSAEPVNFRKINDLKYAFQINWDFKKQASTRETLHFIHICHPSSKNSDKILFYGKVVESNLDYKKPGQYISHIEIDIPDDAPEGDYEIRFGLWTPHSGGRIKLNNTTSSFSRALGGRFTIQRQDGKIVSNPIPGVPTENQIIDFGFLKTNGTFKLVKLDDSTWLLIPAPGTPPFQLIASATKTFGLKPNTKLIATNLDPWTDDAKQPAINQEQDSIQLEMDAKSFAYKLVFK